MATIAEGLFGITPESLMAERDRQAQAQALRVAQLDTLQQARFSGFMATNQLGSAVGGLLGAQDPELMRVRQRQEMLQGVDIADPAALRQAAQRAMAANDFQAAQMLNDRAISTETAQAKLASEQALTTQRNRERAAAAPFQQFLRSAVGKVTPESLSAYQQSGNPSDLVWTEKANQTEIERLQTYRNSLPAGSSERREVDAVIKAAAEGRGTKITNVLPGVEKAGDVTGLRRDIQAITKPYQDQSDAAESAIELANIAIKNGNFAAVSSLSRSLAKAAGETQLSARDVEAFGVDPSLVGRVSDTVSRLAQSRPTVDTLTKLRQVAEALKKKADSRIKLEEDQTIEVARSSKLFTEDQLNTVFRRRPAPTTGSNQKTTRSGVKYTVEND